MSVVAGSWYLPTEIIFGSDSLLNLKKKAPLLGARALLVTGARFAAGSGLLDEILFLLGECETGVVHYAGAAENPDADCVEKGVALCREENCDFIIAAGGGSAIDTAKGIAVLARNPGSVKRYFDQEIPGNAPLPLAAIPTTAGSGSEVTRYSVLTVPGENTKKTINCPGIIPRLALVQPSICLSLPADITAASGLDALSHALEGALSRRASPLSDALAEKAFKLVRENLPEAISCPGSLEARENMSLAALLAGMVINQTGTIIGHGMGYPLTVSHGAPHGLANAAVLPAVTDFFCRRGYAEKLRKLTGWKEPAAGLKRFQASLGVPVSLEALGVEKKDLGRLPALAVIGCRRAVKNIDLEMGEDDFRTIYESSRA